MSLRYHPNARAEFTAAAIWYEAQRPGLGADFQAAVQRAEAAIGKRPETCPRWPGVAAPVRRFVLQRFPFSIAYLAVGSDSVILAIAHQRREPGYWMKRIPAP